MLKKVDNPAMTNDGAVYLHFNTITSGSSGGRGRCYVYNAVMRHTQANKPFVTLHLRDVDGNTLPCYVFDLASPLIAGAELNEVAHQIVEIDWEENYIPRRGLTLRASKVGIVKDTPPEVLGLFTGAIVDVDKKLEEITELGRKQLKLELSFPAFAKVGICPEYGQGKVGGLAEHYWRMYRVLSTMDYVGAEEFRKLYATFVLYIFIHSRLKQAEQKGDIGANFVVDTINRMSSFINQLGLGTGAQDLVNVMLGTEPKDIRVRTVVAISDHVKRVADEYTLYQTIPVQQEGNAGYGYIRRYEL